MDIGVKTDQGRRRKNNEDSCCALGQHKVFVVADGVGGSQSGEIASQTAVKEIQQYVETHPMDEVKSVEDVGRYFETCIQGINAKVLENAQSHEENRGMATTLVIACIIDDQLYVFNVGDSRAYIMRGKTMTQITEDHTYVNSLVKAGVITAEEAKTHENRNMITRAIGAEHRVQPDLFVTTVRSGDILMLCTDGLYGEVTKEEMEEKFLEGKSMQQTCDALVEAANHHGGHDNITIVSLRITEDDTHE